MDSSTLKRLASLSAIGAGAMALTADQAEASVLWSGNLTFNNIVGFGTGGAPSQSFSISGVQGFKLSRRSVAGPSYSVRYVQVSRPAGGGTFRAFSCGCSLEPVAAGATWSSSGPPTTTNQASVQFRVWSPGSSFHYTGGMGPGTHYGLFRFFRNAHFNYGWMQLSIDVQDVAGPDPAAGPTVTVLQWAYDDAGAFLPAGSLTAVPEPGTFFGTGLAALALGAAGWRRRKAQP